MDKFGMHKQQMINADRDKVSIIPPILLDDIVKYLKEKEKQQNEQDKS